MINPLFDWPAFGVCRSCTGVPAGAGIIRGKFERQFKRRDESSLNARRAPSPRDAAESLENRAQVATSRAADTIRKPRPLAPR
jgi:hypothetical protein